MLHDAIAGAYAVGYFEAWDGYSLEAVAEAAEAERSPVILGFGGMMMDQTWLDRYGIEPLGAYVNAVARRLSVPAATMLNEVWAMEHAKRGVAAGFSMVMLNTCELPYEKNVALTRELVQAAHPKGVEVQAELGRLPSFGKDGNASMTDPIQAGDFVQSTGVDCLSGSFGIVHLQTDGAAPVDLGRLRAIRKEVGVPLVVHGGSGFPKDVVAGAIREGVALFHVGSVMKKLFLENAREFLAASSGPEDFQAVVGSRKMADFLIPAKNDVRAKVQSFMRLYGSSGKACP